MDFMYGWFLYVILKEEKRKQAPKQKDKKDKGKP